MWTMDGQGSPEMWLGVGGRIGVKPKCISASKKTLRYEPKLTKSCCPDNTPN